MKEATKNLFLSALEYKMAVVWFLLFSVNSLCTAILAASAGTVWENLHTQEKVTVAVAVLANWTGTIMAFFKSAAKKVAAGQPLFEDTTFTTKQTNNTNP